jgi:hypothetical protein
MFPIIKDFYDNKLSCQIYGAFSYAKVLTKISLKPKSNSRVYRIYKKHLS